MWEELAADAVAAIVELEPCLGEKRFSLGAPKKLGGRGVEPRLTAYGTEGASARELGGLAELLLDPQQLVVLRDPVRARRARPS